MTLFALTADDDAPFRAVLERYFDGVVDERSSARLRPTAS